MSKKKTVGRKATKAPVQRQSAPAAETKGRGSETVPFKHFFEVIEKAVPCVQAYAVAGVPRGGMQIVQPQRVPDVLVKAYAREFHQEDRATWQAIIKNKPVRGADAFGAQYAQCRYLRDYMLFNCNLYHMVAVPLKSPVFAGYPGAIHLYRYREQGPFTDAEIAKVVDVAKSIDEAVEQARQARKYQPYLYQAAWSHRMPQRAFALDAKGKCVFGNESFSELDTRLKQQMTQHAEHRLAKLRNADLQGERLQLPDSRGDLWTFHVTPFPSYPALAEGPVCFFGMQPEANDWATIRPSDFSADTELVRLVPALRFMQQDFHKSPSLGDIARVVHLSPFHFHRRFTELLGLTPKHFLLECQIYEAKRQLMARQKELAEIAADCGFAHQSHFTSRFKQATGLTPTRWRRVAQDLQRASA